MPVVRNIVFFKYVRSPIAFYQMVGRGTRLDAPTNKLMFRVYDYTNATRLFGKGFVTKPSPPREHKEPGPEAPSLDAFRARWIVPHERRELLQHLPDGARSAALVQQLEAMTEYDLYDVLAELGYGLNPRTRSDRAGAFAYKHAGWLSALPPEAAATLKALASQFARAGTEGLENPEVFQTPEVVRAGGLTALRAIGKPADVLHETKERMFAT